MLTPTPAKQRIIIKLNSVPSCEERNSEINIFYVESENQLFRITARTQLFQRLTAHQFEKWIAVISCDKLSKNGKVNNLYAFDVHVFENLQKTKKPPKEAKPLYSPAHPNALIIPERISGESVTELFKALDARKIELPQFQYEPIDGGFVCVAEVPEIGNFEAIATGKKQAKNWVAKLLLQELRTKARKKKQIYEAQRQRHKSRIIKLIKSNS